MTMLRRRLAWGLTTLLLSAVMLMLTAPAALPARLVETLTAGRLQAFASQGSAWDGGATLVAGNGQRLAVTWRLDLSRWYQAELGWIIGMPAQSLRLAVTPWRWEVDSLGIGLPVAALRPFFPGSVANYGWSGEVRLASRKFGRPWLGTAWEGSARVELQALGVRELYGEPLGSYGIDLKPAGDGLELVLSTLSGPLFLDARASWTERRLACAGEAALAPGTAVDVGRLMDHFARRAGPGKWGFSCPA